MQKAYYIQNYVNGKFYDPTDRQFWPWSWFIPEGALMELQEATDLIASDPELFNNCSPLNYYN